jgi:hypothetical protein
VIEQEIHITLRYNLAIGNVTLNEIVYRSKELRDHLMLRVLKEVLQTYDNLIAQLLSRTDMFPAKPERDWQIKFFLKIPIYLKSLSGTVIASC